MLRSRPVWRTAGRGGRPCALQRGPRQSHHGAAAGMLHLRSDSVLKIAQFHGPSGTFVLPSQPRRRPTAHRDIHRAALPVLPHATDLPVAFHSHVLLCPALRYRHVHSRSLCGDRSVFLHLPSVRGPEDVAAMAVWNGVLQPASQRGMDEVADVHHVDRRAVPAARCAAPDILRIFYRQHSHIDINCCDFI